MHITVWQPNQKIGTYSKVIYLQLYICTSEVSHRPCHEVYGAETSNQYDACRKRQPKQKELDAEASAAEQRFLELQRKAQAAAAKRKEEEAKKKTEQARVLGKNGARTKLSLQAVRLACTAVFCSRPALSEMRTWKRRQYRRSCLYNKLTRTKCCVASR